MDEPFAAQGDLAGPGAPVAGPTPSGASWSPWVIAALVVLCGLFLHLRFYPIGNLGVETDFYGDLALAARRLAQGHFSVLDYPHKGPLYPLLLAGIHLVVADWYRAGVLLNLAAAAGIIVLVSRLCRRLFSGRTALGTTLLFASNYIFFVDAHKATTDHLFFLLVLGSIVLLLEASPRGTAVEVRRQGLFLAGSGALAALAFLTRYNGAFLIPAALLALLWIDPPGPALKDRLRRCLLWAGPFVILVLPWFILQLAQTGHLVNTQNLGNISREFLTDPRFPNRPPEEIGSLAQLIARDPARFFLHYLANIPRHFWLDLRHVTNPLAALFVLLGLLRLLLRPPTRSQWVFYSFALIYAAAMGLVFYLPRFRFLPLLAETTLAFSFIFGDEGGSAWSRAPGRLVSPAAPVAEALGRVQRKLRGWGIWGTALPVALLLAPTVWNTAGIELANYHDRPLAVLDAAAFLRKVEPHPDDVGLMSLKPHLAFLTGMRHQGYPWEVGGYEDFLRAVRAAKVRYLCLGDIEVAHVPGLETIAAADTLPGLQRIYRAPSLSLYLVPRDLDPAAEARVWERRAQGAATPAGGAAAEVEELMEQARRLAEDGRTAAAESLLQRGLALAPELERAAGGRQIARALRGNLALLWLDGPPRAEAVRLLRQNLDDLQGTGSISSADHAEAAQTLSLLSMHEEKLGQVAPALADLRAALRECSAGGDTTQAAELAARLRHLRGGPTH